MTGALMDCAGRRARLAAGWTDLDALLVTVPVNVRYLSGFTGSNGIVLIDPLRGDRLYTDARYTARASREAPGLDVEIVRDPFAAVLERLAGRRLGVEAHHLDWQRARHLLDAGESRGIAVVPTIGEVERLRRIKDAEELDLLRQACAITTTALSAAFTHDVHPGVTEREVAIALERRMIDLGADGVAFPSIVASGPNGAVPHHEPTSRVLQSGDLVTVDCGAQVGGYHADCTRTIALDAPAGKLSDLHALVRQAQVAGRAAVRVGGDVADVDAACRRMIDDAGFGADFVHPTGHGVGLAIHEWPTVASSVHATIQIGMVFTVEPGVYLADVGGVRIEDTLAVTADGVEVLTDLPRDP